MKDSFKYTLKNPVKIAAEGKEIPASSIVIHSPRPKDKFEALQLEGLFKRAAVNGFSMSKDISSNDEVDNDANEEKGDDTAAIDAVINFIMIGADDSNIRPFINILTSLITAGNNESPQGTLNGVKLTIPIVEEFSAEDTKNILGGYIYHFLSSI